MRVLMQLLVPALIFVAVVYALNARRSAARHQEQDSRSNPSDTGAFLIILALGAAVAIATALVLQTIWS